MTDALNLPTDQVEADSAEAEALAIVVPELTPVISSNVDAIAHDGTTDPDFSEVAGP